MESREHAQFLGSRRTQGKWMMGTLKGNDSQAEANQLLMTEILGVLNGGGDLQPLMAQVLHVIRRGPVSTRWDCGCEGPDFPYYVQNGFSEEFVREENSLCAKREDGSVLRDADGQTVLECTCGLILSGRTDPTMPCFTQEGSFWTNRSSDLLALLPEVDPRTHPRNRCIHSGYQSVALIPVRSGQEIIGLLQLNAAGRTVDSGVGSLLRRSGRQHRPGSSAKQAEEALRERMKELPCLYAVSRDMQEDLSLEELCRRTVEHLVPAMQFPEVTAAVLELDGKRFTSENYVEGLSHGLQAAIRVESEVLGHLRVYYTQERPFLIPEEQNLVNGVAAALSAWLERKQAEEALRESQHRLVAALEIAALSVWEYRQDTGLIEFDQRSSEMFGTGDQRAMTIEEFLAFVHEEDRQRVAADIRGAFDPAGDGLYDTEYRIVRPDGVQRWLAAGATRSSRRAARAGDWSAPSVRSWTSPSASGPRRNGNDSRPQFSANATDCRRCVNSITDEIWFADAGEETDAGEPRRVKEFGAGVGDAKEVEKIAASFEVYRPDGTVRPVEEAPPLRALRGEIVKDQEEIVRTPATGELRHRQVSAAPVRDAGGAIIGSVSVVRDITERKRAEEALRESEDASTAAVFESSSDCILVWDRQYNYLYANQAAIDHVGTTRDKVIGKNIRDGLGHVPDFMRLWMARVDRAFATGESFRVEDAMPVGDRLVYSESQVSPIRDAAGRVFAVGVVYRDITDRKRAEEALRELNATLESKVAQRTAELQQRARQLQKLTLELSQAEERERRRIAVILHEDLQQQIAGAKFHLSLVRRPGQGGPTANGCRSSR